MSREDGRRNIARALAVAGGYLPISRNVRPGGYAREPVKAACIAAASMSCLFSGGDRAGGRCSMFRKELKNALSRLLLRRHSEAGEKAECWDF